MEPQSPPNIVTSFPTKGEAERAGIFGNFISGIFGSLLTDHTRKEVYKDGHMTITYCPACDPLGLLATLQFEVDASAKLILDTIAGVEEINLGYSKLRALDVKQEEGKYTSIEIRFEKPEKGLDITAMAELVAEKLKSYL